MKQFALAVMITCTLVACTPRVTDEKPVERPKAVSPNAASTAVPGAPPVISGSIAYNIGDVEQGIHLQGTIADESKAPNIEVKELSDSRKVISRTVLNVSPPFPEHLWLRFYANLDKMGPEAPVVVRGNIGFGENTDKVIQPFKFVAFKRQPIDEIKVDVMAHLEGKPDSVLIGSKADIILFPTGTDPKTVNPDTAKGTPETTSILMSNPIRINFNRAQESK